MKCIGRYLVVLIIKAFYHGFSPSLDAHILHIQSRKARHGVSHEIEVTGIYLACYLQISYLCVVFVGSNDGFLESAWRGIDDYILLCRGIMADKVILPRRNAFADKRQFVLSTAGFLIYFDAEFHHFACHIGQVLTLSEFIWQPSYGDAEKRRTRTYSLWHHDSAPFIACM